MLGFAITSFFALSLCAALITIFTMFRQYQGKIRAVVRTGIESHRQQPAAIAATMAADRAPSEHRYRVSHRIVNEGRKPSRPIGQSISQAIYRQSVSAAA